MKGQIRFFLQTLFIPLFCLTNCQQSKNQNKVSFLISLNSGEKVIEFKEQNNTQYLELKDKIDSLKIQSVGEYQVFIQTRTSITVMGEGPHIDLVNWRGGVSPWEKLELVNNEFQFIDQVNKIKFPQISISDFLAKVKDIGDSGWVKVAEKCKNYLSYPCDILPSKYLFRIEKLIDGRWKKLREVELIPPMGG